MATNAIANSVTFRWMETTANLGQRSFFHRTVPSTPSTSPAVSSTRETTPDARVMYQSASRCLQRGSCRLGGPVGNAHHRAVVSHQPRREASLVQPIGCVVTEHHGRGARRVRVDAGGGHDADGSPGRVGRRPFARIDDVMGPAGGRRPTADAGPGGGETARAD